jgi:hypothetical protein
MPKDNINKYNLLEIYIYNNNITLQNRNRNNLIQYRRNLVAEYLNVNGSKLKIRNPKEVNPPSDTLVTNSEQMLIKVNDENVEIDFKEFQDWIISEKSHRYFITDLRTEFDETQEEDVQQELTINLYHPSTIQNLQSALKLTLTYIDTPELLSFAHWVSSSNNRDEMNEAKITSILLDELSRRKNSQENPEDSSNNYYDCRG